MVIILIIEKISSPESLHVKNQLIKLMFRVYLSTKGNYPKLEWLRNNQKPRIDQPDAFKKFRFYYEPFLKWRLKKEIDELFIIRDEESKEIIGVIGINYNLKEKYVPWIPKEYMNRDDIGFIELLAVDPKHQGKGIGSKLFDIAINRLKELGKKPLLTTFPDLKALQFYKNKGGVIIRKMNKYVTIQF